MDRVQVLQALTPPRGHAPAHGHARRAAAGPRGKEPPLGHRRGRLPVCEGRLLCREKPEGLRLGQCINGTKWHLAVDLQGTPVMITVTSAGVQDRDAAKDFLFRLRLTHPEITLLWADGAYAASSSTGRRSGYGPR
ncbi:transposase [Streptomyces sp. NPDC059819]|uniref:transposase n=1 Tax=Streptomyces sp. NPDC059819 TaxID=3346963 RepID=UPI0036520CA6